MTSNGLMWRQVANHFREVTKMVINLKRDKALVLLA